LFAVSFSGCGKGPKLNFCIPDPAGYACSDEHIMPLAEAKDWSCMISRNVERLLRACKNGKVEDVTYCQVVEGGTDAVCTDGSVVNLLGSERWACLSDKDKERLLVWCKRNQKD